MYRPPPGTYSPSPYGGPPSNNPTWRPPSIVKPLIPTAVWKEHTTPEGRKYWYNNMTRQSTWEKPDDLLTPEEKVLKNSAWKEYTTADGKKYYSHSKTKETVWDMPTELKEQIEAAKKVVTEKTTPVVPVRPITPLVPTAYATNTYAPTPYAPPIVPEYTTKEEAEKAFFSLLKETGVKSDWSWEQTMRAIITKPLYRALKTTGERKAAFHAWADAEARREREERDRREAELKSNLLELLGSQSNLIKPYMRYRTIVGLLQHQPAFEAVESRQREAYVEEYLQTLQRQEKEELRDLRKASMERYGQLLRSLEIRHDTSWKDAQVMIKTRQEAEGIVLDGMDKLDWLSVFEEYHRQLWEKPMADLNEKINKRRRRERKARDGFKALLRELVESGKLNVRTLWKDIHEIIKDDERYHAAAGLADSSPLDMFWDVIDELDEQLYQQKKIVYHALKKADLEVDLETTYESYLEAVQKVDVPEENIRFIFEHLQSKAAQRLKEERRRKEKKLKKKLEGFRQLLKHAHITLDDTWESIKTRLEHEIEYKSIEEEHLKLDVFEKYMKRLKEKKEDEDEDEEGMIKEDEEGMIEEEEDRNHSKRKNKRKEYDDNDDYRLKKRKKDYSSTEEGEALDDYQNDPRRLK